MLNAPLHSHRCWSRRVIIRNEKKDDGLLLTTSIKRVIIRIHQTSPSRFRLNSILRIPPPPPPHRCHDPTTRAYTQSFNMCTHGPIHPRHQRASSFRRRFPIHDRRTTPPRVRRAGRFRKDGTDHDEFGRASTSSGGGVRNRVAVLRVEAFGVEVRGEGVAFSSLQATVGGRGPGAEARGSVGGDGDGDGVVGRSFCGTGP